MDAPASSASASDGDKVLWYFYGNTVSREPPPGVLCRSCVARRSTEGLSKCEICRRNNSLSAAWRRKENRALGLCTRCRCPAESGRAECRPCQDKQNAYQAARQVLKKAKLA
jgi:hypothetical protein